MRDMSLLKVMLIFIVSVTISYLISVGIAWIIITLLDLTYSPWILGVVLWLIKLVF